MSVSILKPYHDLLYKLVHEGHHTNITKALYGESITFDLLQMNNESIKDYSLFMPLMRGSLKTSSKYGIAEAIWYRHATRSIDLIKSFGPIWESMTDESENFLINSNYGYQIENNQDVNYELNKLFDVIDGKRPYVEVDFMIASYQNQHSRKDLVCNNKISLSLIKDINGTFKLSSRVVARSIDVIFGLPYDLFAAQGFMTYVAHKLNEKSGYLNFVKLDFIKFDVVNIHWYHKDNPSIESLDKLTDDVLVVKNAYNTPFNMSKSEIIEKFKSVDDIKQYRDNVELTQTEVIQCQSRDLSDLRFELDTYYGNSQQIKDLMYLMLEINQTNTTQTLNRVHDVFEFLNENEFDRKNLIVDENSNLYYIVNTVSLDNQYRLYMSKKEND